MNRLAELLDLTRPNHRGRPLTPVQQVCIALNYYTGSHFSRVAGFCGGVSQGASWKAISRVTSKLADLKEDCIQMPSFQQCGETAQRMLDKFHLPGFAYGVDSVAMKFDASPRNIPENTAQQDFLSCKKTFETTYAIHCQVVGNDRGMILDIIADSPGSVHDAKIWNDSRVKETIESQSHFLAAGDACYPISAHLVTPYTDAEAAEDRSKELFNRRLSALRAAMTAKIFRAWMSRFPCLKFLRCHYPLARNIILATAILHNIAVHWADEDFEDEDEDVDDPGDEVGGPEEQPRLVAAEAGGPQSVQARGQAVRDRLRMDMPSA